MSSLTAAQIMRQVIRDEMNIPDADIWIRDQNKKIPNDNGLYIILGMVDARVISNSNRVYFDDPDMKEENNVMMREVVQIDILSRSTDAFTRRWEIIAALKSISSSQAQEARGFKIARLPESFVNSSSAEGGSQLNRYSITTAALISYSKTKVLNPDSGDYYDQFSTRVDDQKTIGQDTGLIEFDPIGDEVWYDAENWNDLDRWYG